MLRRWLLIVLLTTAVSPLWAQSAMQSIIGGDTLTYSYTPIDRVRVEPHTHRGLGRYLSSFTDNPTNGEMTAPRLHIFGGPGYSTTTNLRLTAIGRLLYPIRRAATDAHPSLLALTASASITGYYHLFLAGANYFGCNRHMLNYDAIVGSMPTYIWGLDYDTSLHNPRGEYREVEYTLRGGYRYAITPTLRLGADVEYRHIAAKGLDASAAAVLHSEVLRLSVGGVGVGVEYDGRDDIASPQRGIRTSLHLMFYPSPLNNIERNMASLDLDLCLYQRVWRGGVVAIELAGELHTRNIPWMLRSKVGGDCRMRGYYPGRFNGINMLTAQVELRQNIWQNLGIALWGGGGITFSKEERMAWRRLLPNYGAGIRWALGGGSTIRLDAGFGRDSYMIIMALSEAF